MTTDHIVAVHPLLQGLTDGLANAGANIGGNTPLGAALMDPAAALVVPGLGLLLMLGLVWQWRRRAAAARQAAQQPALQPQPALTTARPATADVRTHPEALAMLYDTPSRREPSLATPAAPVVAEPAPVVAPVVVQAVAPVADTPVASAPVVSGEGGEAARESASVRLLLSAVDRLLHRVESQQAQIHALLDELKAQSSALVVQGERLLELEARVGGTSAGETAGEEAATPDQHHAQSLEAAISLAAQGLGADELVARCGLSAAEARLINLVHGGNAVSAESSAREREAAAG